MTGPNYILRFVFPVLSYGDRITITKAQECPLPDSNDMDNMTFILFVIPKFDKYPLSPKRARQ